MCYAKTIVADTMHLDEAQKALRSFLILKNIFGCQYLRFLPCVEGARASLSLNVYNDSSMTVPNVKCPLLDTVDVRLTVPYLLVVASEALIVKSKYSPLVANTVFDIMSKAKLDLARRN